jgi:chromosome segregation ATPase
MLARNEEFRMESGVERFEQRVAKLEHMQTDIVEIKLDLRDVRKSVSELNEKFERKFEAMNEKFDKQFKAMDEKFDKKFEVMDEKFDKKFEAMNEKFETRFNSLEVKISELKVWALLVIGGGVLSVIGHAFHWI